MKTLIPILVVLFLTATTASAFEVGDWVETTEEFVSKKYDLYFRGKVIESPSSYESFVLVDIGCKEKFISKGWLQEIGPLELISGYFSSECYKTTTTTTIKKCCCCECE